MAAKKKNRRWHSVPADVKQTVLDQIDAGVTANAAAVANGLSPSAVHRWIKLRGPAPSDARAERYFSEDKKAEIVAAAAATNAVDAAAKYGVSPKSVRNWRKQAGQSTQIVPVSRNGHSNGGGDLVSAFGDVMQTLKPLTPVQRKKLLASVQAMVEG